MHPPIEEIQNWFSTLRGQALMSQELSVLEDWWQGSRADALVQFSGPVIPVSEISLGHHYRLYLGDRPPLQEQQSIHGLFDGESLPLQPSSVQIALIWHALEWMKKPEVFLSELYASMVPGGYVFIWSFNPRSWLGCKKLWMHSFHRKEAHQFPWSGYFWTREKILHYLGMVGFRFVHTRMIYFLPPAETAVAIQWVRFWEVAGQFLCPGVGGAYLLVMQKEALQKVKQKTRAWYQPAFNQGI